MQGDKRVGAEKDFENRVKDFLKKEGIYFSKNFGCGVGKYGKPDLFICLYGYFLGVELKATYGKMTPLQKNTLKKIEESKGHVMLLKPDDFEKFKNLVRSAKKLETESSLIQKICI